LAEFVLRLVDRNALSDAAAVAEMLELQLLRASLLASFPEQPELPQVAEVEPELAKLFVVDAQFLFQLECSQ